MVLTIGWKGVDWIHLFVYLFVSLLPLSMCHRLTVTRMIIMKLHVHFMSVGTVKTRGYLILGDSESIYNRNLQNCIH